MIAIISDIHGNYPALQSVLEEIDEIGCEMIYSLGDIAGYGCMINECISELRARNIVNIMGNHDYYLTSNTKCPRSNSANLCLDYQRNVITQSNMEWLSGSVNRISVRDISMVHAGWNDPIDEYLYQVNEEYFRDRFGTIFISGHTHVQVHAQMGNKIFCNPGSVGQPRDGDHRAAYVILDGDQINLRRVRYNIDAIADAMKEAGFDSYIYSNLYAGTKIGGEISEVSIK